MRIGIDIRKYFDFGIGTYIQNLLAEFNKNNHLALTYFATDEQKIILHHSLSGTFVAENSAKYSLQELFSVSKSANTSQIELLHVPHYTLPFNLKKKSVVTVHDLIHIRLLKYFNVVQRMYASFMLRHTCRNASHIIVVSEFTKNDMMNSFNIGEQNISVIPHGIEPLFFQQRTENDKSDFKKRANITKPYLLYTGSLKPHKNVPLLIKAFKEIRKSADVQLVLAGESIETRPEIAALCNLNDKSKNIISLGYLNRVDLVTAYQCAEVVVLPSVYEGFGFSMIEAMASGVPALGARATSIPEIVADGGLLFDPYDADDLVNKFFRIYSDKNFRSELISRGKKRVANFSWQLCAQKTLDVYRKVLA